MKKLLLLALLLVLSCINMLKPPQEYHSLYFQGGAWIEIPNQGTENDISVLADRFSLQFWVSGDEIETTEAPALFSVVDENQKLIIGMFRDPGRNNTILFYLNDNLVLDTALTGLNWSKPDKFYLFTIMSNGLNNIWDCGEELEDESNGIWDEGELFSDYGLDLCPDSTETGYSTCLDTLNYYNFCGNDTLANLEAYIDTVICDSFITAGLGSTEWDPNGDNSSNGGTEGNGVFDWVDLIENDIQDIGEDSESFHDIGNGIWDEGETWVDAAGFDLYFNKDKIYHSNLRINVDDESLMLGAVANKEYSIIENFWYGYLDEVRLWSTLLEDTTIIHQYHYPNQLSSYYLADMDCTSPDIDTLRVEEALRGLWRFNLEDPVSEILEDESGNGNTATIYTLSGYSLELSTKGAP